MNKENIEQLIKKYCIVDDEISGIFAFVYDVIKMERDRCKEEEPYATISIRDMEKAMSVIDDIGIEVEVTLL